MIDKVNCTQPNEISDEINNFLRFVGKNNSVYFDIAKTILFFKKIFSDLDQNHYAKSLVHDFLCTVYALENASEREFFNNYRSILENFIRVILMLDDTDSTGVFRLFKAFEKKCHAKDMTSEFAFIKYEYDIACNYVHSNKNANMNICEYYTEIPNDKISEEDREMLAKRFSELCYIFKKQCIAFYPSKVGQSFYRRNFDLKYLIGEDLFEVFKMDYLEK